MPLASLATRIEGTSGEERETFDRSSRRVSGGVFPAQPTPLDRRDRVENAHTELSFDRL
jgi:hypothetical protein